jgi:hypothetical protein
VRQSSEKYAGRKLNIFRRFGHGLRAIFLLPIVLITEFQSFFGSQHSKFKFSIDFLNDVSNSTHGRGLLWINSVICFLKNRGKKNYFSEKDLLQSPSGVGFSKGDREEIVKKLKEDGFYKIPQFLTPQTVDEIKSEIDLIPGQALGGKFTKIGLTEWESDPKFGPRIDVDFDILSENNLAKDIANNELMRDIANRYIGCKALLAPICSWTTRPPLNLDKATLSNAAMAFHADADYFKFIKFFIILTDVTPEHGPFAYIKSSNNHPRHVAWRISDDKALGKTDTLLLGTGKKGDLVIADTSGWHKATPPLTGTRTMVQFLFTSSLFGRTT